MTLYFVDTSALAKYYVAERGTVWIRQLCSAEAANQIIVSALTLVEMTSVLRRKEREQRITPTERLQLQQMFKAQLFNQYYVIQLNDVSYERAIGLVETYPLRTLDALQLACALETQSTLGTPLTFLSADVRLLSIVMAEGLAFENPENFV